MRSAMLAASQLPERGPLMWMMPLHLQANQKSHKDDDMGLDARKPVLGGLGTTQEQTSLGIRAV